MSDENHEFDFLQTVWKREKGLHFLTAYDFQGSGILRFASIDLPIHEFMARELGTVTTSVLLGVSWAGLWLPAQTNEDLDQRFMSSIASPWGGKEVRYQKFEAKKQKGTTRREGSRNKGNSEKM